MHSAVKVAGGFLWSASAGCMRFTVAGILGQRGSGIIGHRHGGVDRPAICVFFSLFLHFMSGKVAVEFLRATYPLVVSGLLRAGFSAGNVVGALGASIGSYIGTFFTLNDYVSFRQHM